MMQDWREVWVLAAAEGLNLRAYARVTWRDSLFAVSIVTIAAFAVGILAQSIAGIEALPAVRPWAAFAWGAFLIYATWLKPGSRHVMQLQSGVFLPWTAFGLFHRRCMLVR